MSTSTYTSMAQRMLDRAWQARRREAGGARAHNSIGGFPVDFEAPILSAPETPPEFHVHAAVAARVNYSFGGFPEDFQDPILSAHATPPEFHWRGVDGESEKPFPVRCLGMDPSELM